jgi:hypothetical protein
VASHGVRVRDRVKDLTVRALQDRTLRRGEVSGLVDEVLEGASDGLEASIPASRTSVLRQVFEGLSDAVGEAASAGAGAARELRRRGETIARREVPAAARRVRAANEEFLSAAGRFASRLTGEAREELESLVRRARRSGSAVGASARDAAAAADGRLLELTGEAVRAGVGVVRRAAGGLAMAAGGLLEGLAEVATPKAPRRARVASKRKPAKKSAGRKPAKKRRRG